MAKNVRGRLASWKGPRIASVLATLLLFAVVAGCASLGEPPAGPGSEEEARAPAPPPGRRYSPWPVTLDRSFIEGALLATDSISFSHPRGWYFRAALDPGARTRAELDIQVLVNQTTIYREADTGTKLALMRGGGRLVGRIVVAPLESVADTAPATRFLQWISRTGGGGPSGGGEPSSSGGGGERSSSGGGPSGGGENNDTETATLLWSDEAVTARTPGQREARPLYLALIRHNDRPQELFSAIAWQRLGEEEIVVQIAGPQEAVRESLPDLIRLAKSVGGGAGDPPEGDAASTGGAETGAEPRYAAATRRIPGGLQFSDPTGAWRWSADLADGFILTTTAPPRLRVAVWRDGEEVRFEVLSQADAPGDSSSDARVQALLEDTIALRAAASGAGR